MPTICLFMNTEFPSQFELSDLNGWNGFVLNGVASLDTTGASVSDAGDLNDDGMDDFVIGAMSASPLGRNSAGTSYVVFGNTHIGGNGTLELSSLDGVTGFALRGVTSSDYSGYSVSGAGDVNGDGISDLLIGAPYASPDGRDGAGIAYVVFGHRHIGGNGTFELSNLNGTTGFSLIGRETYDFSGRSVSSAGDLNDDGMEDLLIGAPGLFDVGHCYVVFGKSGLGDSGVYNLSTLDGINGFVLTGRQASDFTGLSVSAGGDVNGDNVVDLLIGAPSINLAYVVFGKLGLGGNGVLKLDSLNGTDGFVLNGISGSSCCYSVSMTEDVNGDRLEDILIGASNTSPGGRLEAGITYVVLSQPGIGMSGAFELSSLNGTTGFALNGVSVSEQSGTSVSGAGDINGDGLGDFLIGATGLGAAPGGRFQAGKTYVLFGKHERTDTNSIELSSLDGISGFVLNGVTTDDSSGESVSGAGDVNGDGIADILIGAPSASPGGQYRAGACYVIFGDIPPRLLTNYLHINQGETFIFTPNNLNATHFSQTADKIIFNIGYLSHGRFQLVSAPGTAITSFTQGQIRQSQVQFVHSGTNIPPSYQVATSSGRFILSTPQSATIDFDAAPVFVNTSLIVTQNYQQIVLSTREFSAVDVDNSPSQLFFNIRGLQNGEFSWKNTGILTTNFSLQNVMDGEVIFTGTDQQPFYFASVSDGRIISPLQKATVRFTAPPVVPSSSNSIINTAIGAGVGTVGVLAIALGTYGYFRSDAREKLNQAVETLGGGVQSQSSYRKNVVTPLVKTIYEHLKIGGFLGHLNQLTANAFVKAITTLIEELQQKEVDLDMPKMSHEHQQRFLREIVRQTRLQTVEQTCASVLCHFFKPEVTPAQIEAKAPVIAAVVSEILNTRSSDAVNRKSNTSETVELQELPQVVR